MEEMLPVINDADKEKYQNEIYEKFKKQIDTFYNLPNSTFADMRGGDGSILDLERAKTMYANGIKNQFENSGLNEKQLEELSENFSKTFYGGK